VGSRRAPREARAVGEASEGFAVAPQRRRPRRRRMRGDGARQHRLHIPAARPSAKCRFVKGRRRLSSAASPARECSGPHACLSAKVLTVRRLKVHNPRFVPKACGRDVAAGLLAAEEQGAHIGARRSLHDHHQQTRA